MKPPVIELFYADICGLCHKAMDYFRSRGLSFTAHEVFWDHDRFRDTPSARAMKERCGDVDFVPQIFVNGVHIPGWRKLEPMIQSGEFDRLISTGHDASA
ncbi:MAG TPA: glutaredoxin domain-containing protein [Kiritimatiellia bacterium]|nr:glutaredoxin domain-containing protein [Kiritimatiellia bacterium]HMP32854.1 glutaredoxin domain-containing protein [Kiritimatiellia bacterium]